MSKIIAAGHICIDITPVFPEHQPYHDLGELLVPGKLVRMEAADVHTGGSVANTGLALKLLGNDVQLLGKVGCDAFGSMIQNIVASYDANGLLTDPDSSTSYSVVLAIPGVDRVFLHNPGANDSFSSEDIPEEALEETVLFHFGYPPLMKTMYADNGAELIRIFRRIKEHGIATSLDFAAIDPHSESGRADWKQILREFYPAFEKTLHTAEKEIERVEVKDEISDVPCDQCGAMMVYKMGRYGRFLACPNFPDCRNTRPILNYIETPCPKCGKRLLEKISKKSRKFYGCEGYPECDFVSWEMPVNDKCPQCGSYMVEKNNARGEKLHLCSNENCRYKTVVTEPEETADE